MTTNKFIVKIASASDGISDELRDPDFARAGLRAGLFGAATGVLGGTAAGLVTKSPFGRVIASTMGAGVGISSGLKASFKNQLRDQQLHDIKLQGAAQRQESHEARMHKMAEINKHQAIKDGANLATIAGLGGLGTVAASHILPVGASKSKIFAVGTGIGLVADYAGLKINDAFNKHMDNKYLNKVASTAMSRNLNRSGTSMTLGGGDTVGSANRARMGAMVGRGASGAGSRAANANAGHVSSGFLNRSVDSGKVDRLATTSIHERLADARANLKLSPADGNRVKQITNASAIRNSKPGAAGSLFGQGSATNGAANASALNKGLVDAKAGYQAHTQFSKKLSRPVASLSSSAPPAEVAKSGTGLLGKARALLGTRLGKGLAIGGAALGVGALAHHALKSNNEDRVQYSYG